MAASPTPEPSRDASPAPDQQTEPTPDRQLNSATAEERRAASPIPHQASPIPHQASPIPHQASPTYPVDAGTSLVLASTSPRRRELLGRLGVEFDVAAIDVDETPLPAERPEVYVARLAEAKARAGVVETDHGDGVADARTHHRGGVAVAPRGRSAGESRARVVVLAADTTIDLDGEILGKPRDRDHAVELLTRLAGRRHVVHTGVAVAASDGSGVVVDVEVATTEVEMAPLDAERIAWYVATGEPLDAAGAYMIQGRGDLFVSATRGSLSNVVGLPLATTVTMLIRVGLLVG